ncbi:FecR family protein [Sphingomonas sp. CJ20]
MSSDTDDMAVHWALRVDANTMDGAERSAMDAWLAHDPRNRGALFRARAALTLLERGDAAAADALPSSTATVAAPLRRRRAPMLAGLAAACAAVFALPWLVPASSAYQTAKGQIREVALSDGSVAVLNTDSRVEVDYGIATRRIALGRGEAWFKVAHNAARPFIVEADGVLVRATGTAFSVREREGAVVVAVTEGSVEIWRGDHAGRRVMLRAGDMTSMPVATPGQPQPAAAIDAPLRIEQVPAGEAPAWREGGAAFNETTVEEAAAELNRYNQITLHIADPAIAGYRITGYFEVSKPLQFADAVARITGAHVSRNRNEIFIEK